MPITPSSIVFSLLDNDNVVGASLSYQSFLVAGSITQPFGVAQIGPFAFDYEGDDSVTLQNDITDHWVEDNVAVQDHIGVRPVMITLKGRTSELTLSASTLLGVSSALSTVENALSQVPAYIGTYTPGIAQRIVTAITQVQNVAVQIEQAAARIAQIANFFAAGGHRNKQQTAFAMLSALRNARILFTVYTPFQVFYNMAIVNIQATQPANMKTVSDFTVSMKQLQFTDNISQSSFQSQFGGRAAAGYQPATSNGITTGITQTFSTVSAFF